MGSLTRFMEKVLTVFGSKTDCAIFDLQTDSLERFNRCFVILHNHSHFA